MRKILISLVILVVLAGAWFFVGQQIAPLVDRVWTIQSTSVPIHSIAYEGTGNGGLLHVGEHELGLTPANPQTELPHLGSTKDDQFALAMSGKVFTFGPLNHTEDDRELTCDVESGDTAFLITRHSVIVRVNRTWFTNHNLPMWRRGLYYALVWKKPTGASLELVWKFEQFFFPGNGWGETVMTRDQATGLTDIEISEPH
jgi:hypothetical protein